MRRKEWQEGKKTDGEHCESPVLYDVIDSMSLTHQSNGHISGIHYLRHKGQTRTSWESDKEEGAGSEVKKSVKTREEEAKRSEEIGSEGNGREDVR